MAQFCWRHSPPSSARAASSKSVAGGHVSPLPEESWLRSAGVFTILDGAGSEVLDIGPRVAREESHDSLRGRYARRRLADSAETLKRMRESAALGNGHHGAVPRDERAHRARRRQGAGPRERDARVGRAPRREAAAMRLLGGRPGFPRLYYRGRQPVFGRVSDVFVMELLGPSAEARCGLSSAAADDDDGDDDGADLCEGRLPRAPPCFASAARSSTASRRCTASRIHNDLKPTNFLFGPPGTETADTVHLIDFGQVTRPARRCRPRLVERQAAAIRRRHAALRSVASAREGQPTVAADDVLAALWSSDGVPRAPSSPAGGCGSRARRRSPLPSSGG